MSQKIDHQKPNIVLIMTDQQRADTIAELGHPWMQTPNLGQARSNRARPLPIVL
jgi:arylsulfatase A-like enzyme